MASAEQKITYPEDKPIFSILFPDDWEVEGDEESVSASSKDEFVNMELIALEVEALKDSWRGDLKNRQLGEGKGRRPHNGSRISPAESRHRPGASKCVRRGGGELYFYNNAGDVSVDVGAG